MRKLLLISLLAGMGWGCSEQPNSPEHVCETYLACINAQKWDLASRYIFDSSILSLSSQVTKKYQWNKVRFLRTAYATDSTKVRLNSVLLYNDDTYLDLVFFLEKEQATQQWKIRSL